MSTTPSWRFEDIDGVLRNMTHLKVYGVGSPGRSRGMTGVVPRHMTVQAELRHSAEYVRRHGLSESGHPTRYHVNQASAERRRGAAVHGPFEMCTTEDPAVSKRTQAGEGQRF